MLNRPIRNVTMPLYNKLIRDLIPEIIEKTGKQYTMRTLEETEYREHLDKKLQEELDEYLASGKIAELADMMEVIYAISSVKGVSNEEFEAVRVKKSVDRQRWLLETVVFGECGGLRM